MNPPFFKLWRNFQASYWFVPSIMVVLAILLGAGAIWLDSGPTAGLFDGLGWYQQSKPDGAREVLSTIAGSMITVAGVVFSITIVAISFAANQYGPRILTNFMGDRGNQITLGTFIATFVYSVVVLRTIYSGDEEFVPQLAVMIALLLALCSIIVLIYFIHHVPESIHINTITSSVGKLLIRSIDKRFPARFGDPPEHSAAQEEDLRKLAQAAFARDSEVKTVESSANGYVQLIDESHLLSCAREHGLIVSIKLAPGEFAYCGRAVALVASKNGLDEKAEKAIRDSWAVGSSRTPGQDLLFLIDELVEVAARALSTGVNDPYTAMTCLDWLTAAAAELARRQPASPYRVDDDGNLRVVAPTGSFALYLQRGFGRLQPYFAADANAAAHFLSQLASLSEQCRSVEQIEAVDIQAEALLGLARRELHGASLDRIEKEADTTGQATAAARTRLSKRSAGGR
ncbi:MAG: DUF2254 domain-containing protein [Sphingomonas sp.]|nr:DUF2254 domain-containing protein [Sphingomonas sp.]